jgi:hypothetical protein
MRQLPASAAALVRVPNAQSKHRGLILGAWIFGARPPFRLSVRAASYLSALLLLSSIVGFVPGFFSVFLLAAQNGLSVWGWQALAKHRVGLGTGRSWLCAGAAMFSGLLGAVVSSAVLRLAVDRVGGG